MDRQDGQDAVRYEKGFATNADSTPLTAGTNLCAMLLGGDGVYLLISQAQ